MNNKLLLRLNDIFLVKLNRKSNWGRNEVVAEFKQSIREAITEVFMYIEDKSLINTKLLTEIQTLFIDDLNHKTGYGKNEVFICYKDCAFRALVNLYNLDNVQD
jgi:hypothetical protein